MGKNNDKYEIYVQPQPLTNYPTGSIREILFISVPLILSAASGSLMFFVDRLILAQLSTDAMNAAASAGMFCYIFHYGAIGVAAIAEVFVGQFNGNNQTKKLGEPVWQMFWFCLVSFLVFWPLAVFGGKWFVPDSQQALGLGYYQWFMGFGPLFAMVVAISAFFIGQGKVKLVFFIVSLGNLVNLILDWLLIFGYHSLIPAKGVEGAAIATILAQVFQIICLLVVFLNKNNRKTKGTACWRLNPKLFIDCLKLGVPNALGHMVEISAWTVLLFMLESVGNIHLTIFSIGQAVFVLFIFITDGLQKGVIAVASNVLGGDRGQDISSITTAAIKVLAGFACFLAIPLIIFPDPLVNAFVESQSTTLSTNELHHIAVQVCFWIWLYFIFDGLVWIIAGVLTAAGDTKYVMWVNIFTGIFCSILPIYWFVVRADGPPILTWKLVCFYGLANLIAFTIRYKRKKWQASFKLKTA